MADNISAPSIQTSEDNVLEVLRGRAATYSLLSRLYSKEVDSDLLASMKAMAYPANTGDSDVDEGYRLIRHYLALADDNALTELAIDYVRAFIGSGNDGYCAAYPYESVYTSPKRLMMQEARDEVLALYRAASLEKLDSWKESEDHIGLELEYLAILSERAADAAAASNTKECLALLRMQRNFLEDHLLSWYPMMAEDLQKYAKTDFYLGLGHLTAGFLNSDKALVDELLEANEADEKEEADKAASATGATGAADATGATGATGAAGATGEINKGADDAD